VGRLFKVGTCRIGTPQVGARVRRYFCGAGVGAGACLAIISLQQQPAISAAAQAAVDPNSKAAAAMAIFDFMARLLIGETSLAPGRASVIPTQAGITEGKGG
jgi:hypothetical protein